jgi:hypothetical protein
MHENITGDEFQAVLDSNCCRAEETDSTPNDGSNPSVLS